MITFDKARQALGPIGRAARYDADGVRALWDAVSGNADLVPPRTFAEAASDTYPVKHAALLSDPTACSYAASCLLRALAGATGLTVTQDDASDGAQALSAAASLTPIALRDTARKGWTLFDQRVDQADKIATGLGWDLSASLPHVQKIPDNSDKMRMLKRVADLAGRMRRALRGARAKRSPGVPGEYSGVEQSDALRRMTGSQQQPLAHDLAEWLVWEAYVRKGLQTFKTRGPAKEGRGPLVIAIDESGSMKHGRNEWAKAAMLALARSAHEDGRPVAVVAFSEVTHVTVLKPGDIAAQVDALFHFLGGGTDIPLALRVAKTQVDVLAKAGHRGADVILITDGEDPRDDLKQDAVGSLLAQGTRLWTIAIEIAVREEDPIRAKAAKYVPLDSRAMNDPAVLTAVANAL